MKKHRIVSLALAILLCLSATLGLVGCDREEELEALRQSKAALEASIAELSGKVSDLESYTVDVGSENAALRAENAALKEAFGLPESIGELENYPTAENPTDYVRLSVSYTDSLTGARKHGDIVIHLRPDVAPITVANFKTLVADRFYDLLTFHRVYKSFMIQGGCPNGDGSGSTETIKGEFSANGVENTLLHKRGVVSMARRGDSMDSASCQFFIMHEDAESLDGQYASFGEVIYGMETVDGIANTPVTYNLNTYELSLPVDLVVINSITFVKPIE